MNRSVKLLISNLISVKLKIPIPFSKLQTSFHPVKTPDAIPKTIPTKFYRPPLSEQVVQKITYLNHPLMDHKPSHNHASMSISVLILLNSRSRLVIRFTWRDLKLVFKLREIKDNEIVLVSRRRNWKVFNIMIS